MHYLQLDPSRSNLPKDSTGRIKGGPGHKKGAPNVLSRLSKDRIARVFEELGGVKGMYDWVRKDPKNEYASFTYGPSCSGPRRWTRGPRGWLIGRLPGQGL